MENLLQPPLEQSDTITELSFGDKHYTLIGTAHISPASVAEVVQTIRTTAADHVAVELDEARYAALTQREAWRNLNLYQVLRQGKGFMLLANLILAGFQKRMGLDSGITPGEEMRQAVQVCEELDIPFSFIDRNIQITLGRAWGKSSWWSKMKLLYTLINSAFTNEKFDAGEIENLKKKSALHGMMENLAEYLPTVKHVLIDERDQFMAQRLFETPGNRIVAVVGAGHVPGLSQWLHDLHTGARQANTEEISQVSRPSIIPKIIAWGFPVLLAGLVGYAFVQHGWEAGLGKLLNWMIIHGGLVSLGIAAALGHPLTILLGGLLSPLGTLRILGSTGLMAASIEAIIRKPRVSDLENLQADAGSLRGFYRNRVTRTLLVFILSSVGGIIGNILSLPVIFK